MRSAHPHPGPLPEGEGEAYAVSRKTVRRSSQNRPMKTSGGGARHSVRAVHRAGEPRGAQSDAPYLKGQVEGGCSTNFSAA